MQPEKRYYMAAIDLEGRDCLVVGGGAVAHEKIVGLLDCGAVVTVVAREISDAVHALPVDLAAREYRDGDLEGRFLVVAATDDNELNRRVHAGAEARGLLCNVVDVPELCNFILPAVHRVDPIAIAVSTGGASPALAKRIRNDIAAIVGEEHADLARELRALRPWAKQQFATYEQRRAYFDDLVAQELG
jgi:siroheme synthase-like protein